MRDLNHGRDICGNIPSHVNGILPATYPERMRADFRTMLEDLLKRIEDRLKALDLSARAASLRAGLNADAIRMIKRAIEEGREGVSTNTIVKLAEALNTSVSWLMEGVGEEDVTRMVPIVGLAGAGPDGSVLFATGDGNFGEVPAPLGSSPTTQALEVRGDSMHGLANDGWMVWYDDVVSPTVEHMGEPCVCFLEDERVLIKIPYPGSERGLYNLESLNAPTMRDVPVRHMAFVTDIKPKRSAQKWVRRNPEEPINDVTTDGKPLADSNKASGRKRKPEPA